VYIGQTGRNFTTGYEEHKRTFRYNNQFLKHALHTSTQQHAFGNINDCLKILHTQKKDAHLNTTECFYIFKEASTHNHLNDPHTVPSSSIFQIILSDFIGENS
jgi:spore germination protein YaaH